MTSVGCVTIHHSPFKQHEIHCTVPGTSTVPVPGKVPGTVPGTYLVLPVVSGTVEIITGTWVPVPGTYRYLVPGIEYTVVPGMETDIPCCLPPDISIELLVVQKWSSLKSMRMLCAAMTMSSHPCWTFSKRSVLALFASTTTLDRVKATQGEHTQTPHSLNTTQNEQPQCLIINV